MASSPTQSRADRFREMGKKSATARRGSIALSVDEQAALAAAYALIAQVAKRIRVPLLAAEDLAEIEALDER